MNLKLGNLIVPFFEQYSFANIMSSQSESVMDFFVDLSASKLCAGASHYLYGYGLLHNVFAGSGIQIALKASVFD